MTLVSSERTGICISALTSGVPEWHAGAQTEHCRGNSGSKRVRPHLEGLACPLLASDSPCKQSSAGSPVLAFVQSSVTALHPEAV